MSPKTEPNPPSRKDEDFPKTNTIPGGWVMEELMDYYNTAPSNGKAKPAAQEDLPVPTTGKTAADSASQEELFSRRLDPFPAPGEQYGMYL